MLLRNHGVAIPPPDPADLQWLAALLDSKGHFAKDGRIVLCMTDMQTLQWVQDRFPGSLSSPWQEPGKPNPRRMWALGRRPDIVFLVPLLLPHLQAKKREAEIVLELARVQLSKKTKKWPPDLARRRRALVDEMVQVREARSVGSRAARSGC